jgi:hypothetical protein
LVPGWFKKLGETCVPTVHTRFCGADRDVLCRSDLSVACPDDVTEHDRVALLRLKLRKRGADVGLQLGRREMIERRLVIGLGYPA